MQQTDSDWLESIVDLERYPLNQPGSPAWHALMDDIHAALEQDGCSVLQGFVRKGMLAGLAQEGRNAAPHAHYMTETVNAYNVNVDAEWDDSHPARITFERGNAFVARDLLPDAGMISRLYTSKTFQQFIATCFGVDAIHELADPLAGLCVNVLTNGKEHPWHFDTNEFTVSLLTQAAASGGVFEFCPNIREPGHENLQDVKAVLEGDAAHKVKRLTLRCGDLQLFRGRHSLHRVTPVAGDDERHTAIFAYTEKPGVIGNVERTRQLFGRVLDVHYDAQSQAVRSDKLLD